MYLSVRAVCSKHTSFLTCCHSRVLCRRSLAVSTHWTHSQGSGSTRRGPSHWELHRSQGWSCPSPPSPHVPGSLSRTWSWTQYYQSEPPWFWTPAFSPLTFFTICQSEVRHRQAVMKSDNYNTEMKKGRKRFTSGRTLNQLNKVWYVDPTNSTQRCFIRFLNWFCGWNCSSYNPVQAAEACKQTKTICLSQQWPTVCLPATYKNGWPWPNNKFPACSTALQRGCHHLFSHHFFFLVKRYWTAQRRYCMFSHNKYINMDQKAQIEWLLKC